MKVVAIMAVPAPYRNPVFGQLNDFFGKNFTAIYCTGTEPLRGWKYKITNHEHIYLKDNYKKTGDQRHFVHNNLDIWKHLLRIKPDVVIINGFNPTHLYGWLYAFLFRKKHIVWIEGWKLNDAQLTPLHTWVRKLVFSYTQAYIGPGIKTADLYKSYGAKDCNIFTSPLFADAEKFNLCLPFNERQYDIMFSGQLYERKMPLFFVEVAEEIAKVYPKLRVLIVGDGPLKENVLSRFSKAQIDYHYPGLLPHEDLPQYYSASKIFLFTTKLDAWGVVANEALATGTPVITTPYAGVSDDLVQNNINGFVLEPNVKLWAEKVVELLSNQDQWELFSKNSSKTLEFYNQHNAAEGIIDACYYAMKLKRIQHSLGAEIS